MQATRKRARHEIVTFDIDGGGRGETAALGLDDFAGDEGGGGSGTNMFLFGGGEGGGLDGNETPAPEPVEEDRDYYVPCELPSRRRERKRLGKPSSRDECFFCARAGEKEAGVLPSSDIAKMQAMIHEYTGKMALDLLAEQVANYFASFRARMNPILERNGKPPLPPMSAATVARHVRKDHHDIEVKLPMRLDTVQEAIEEVTKCLMERNKKTRKTRGNKVQIDNLDKLIKLELLLHRVQPDKMYGYSAGARINPNVHKQGVVANNTRNLLDYWRRGGGE